jgi:hypothetical protein
MIETFDCLQYTPEWWALRLGIPTASGFSLILAKGEGKSRKKYQLELLGERLLGESQEPFASLHTERGRIMEAEAREMYGFDVQDMHQVGFVRRAMSFGYVGCSPDSLIGKEGILEVKTRLPHLQLDLLLKDAVPPEHIAQCQGLLWVTQRKWVDFISYWPNLPLFVRRVEPDPEYQTQLGVALAIFCEELKALELKIPKASVRFARRAFQVPNEFKSLE